MKQLLIVLLLLGGGHYAWNYYMAPTPTSAPLAPEVTQFSQTRITEIAHSVRSGEVTLYTTSSCPYCAQAKSWLSANGFTYQECNMTVSRSCEREFLAFGGTGTPFIVIRRDGKTQYMREGFGSEEFLSLL